MERDGDLITRKELRSLHQAGRRKGNIEAVEKFYGNECVSCGSHENLEYHHIVPLYVGGSNRPTNIVPLCKQCHYAVHYGVRLDKSKLKRISGGRKKDIPTEKEVALYADYVWSRIPRSEYIRQTGKRPDPSSHKWQEEYLRENKISKLHNFFGTKLALSGVVDVGDFVGKVKLDSGEVIRITASRKYTAEEYGIDVRVQSPNRAAI